MLLAGELKHRPTTSARVADQIAAHRCRAVDRSGGIKGHSCTRTCSVGPSGEFIQNRLLAGGIQHEYGATAGAAILVSAIRSSPVNISFFIQRQVCIDRREISSAPGEAVQDRLLAGFIDFENRTAAVIRGCAVRSCSSLKGGAIKIAILAAG
jgi:hypothetical protein